MKQTCFATDSAEGGSGKTKERRKVRDKTGWGKAKVGISEICCWVCPLFVTLQIQWRCKNRLENSSGEKNLYPYIPLSSIFLSNLAFGFSVTWTDLSTYKSFPLPTSLVCYFMCFCIICRVCFDLHSSWMCSFLFSYQKENCLRILKLILKLCWPKIHISNPNEHNSVLSALQPWKKGWRGKISLNNKWPLHTLIKCPNCSPSWLGNESILFATAGLDYWHSFIIWSLNCFHLGIILKCSMFCVTSDTH